MSPEQWRTPGSWIRSAATDLRGLRVPGLERTMATFLHQLCALRHWGCGISAGEGRLCAPEEACRQPRDIWSPPPWVPAMTFSRVGAYADSNDQPPQVSRTPGCTRVSEPVKPDCHPVRGRYQSALARRAQNALFRSVLPSLASACGSSASPPERRPCLPPPSAAPIWFTAPHHPSSPLPLPEPGRTPTRPAVTWGRADRARRFSPCRASIPASGFHPLFAHHSVQPTTQKEIDPCGHSFPWERSLRSRSRAVRTRQAR